MTGTERLLSVVNAILESVQEAGPQGAPSGPMYAAVQGYLSLDQYTKVMGALEQTGKVTRRGHVYYARETPSVVDRVLAASWASQASE